MRISSHTMLLCGCTIMLLILSLMVIQFRSHHFLDFPNLRVSTEERKEEVVVNRILYVSDDRFVRQHQRSPREQDIKHLSLPPCRDIMDTEISNFIEVGIPYKYELEIEVESQTNYDSTMTQAITAVENAVNKSLEKSLFSFCVFSKRRNLNSSLSIESHKLRGKVDDSRSLEMQGILSSPSDSLDKSALCSHQLSSQNTECGIVNGGLYLYFNKGTDETEVQKYIFQVLDTIKKNCENGAYQSVSKEIINITFLDDKLSRFQVQIEPKITATTTIKNSFPKKTSYIVIASISSFLILTSMLCKNSEDDKDLRSNSSYVVECDLNMKPHSMINRRISEITIHAGDFDFGAMKRRASLESDSMQHFNHSQINSLKSPPTLLIKTDEHGNTDASIALGTSNYGQSQNLREANSNESRSTATTEDSDTKILSPIIEYPSAESSSATKSPSSGSTRANGVHNKVCIERANRRKRYQKKISDLSDGMDEYVRNT